MVRTSVPPVAGAWQTDQRTVHGAKRSKRVAHLRRPSGDFPASLRRGVRHAARFSISATLAAPKSEQWGRRTAPLRGFSESFVEGTTHCQRHSVAAKYGDHFFLAVRTSGNFSARASKGLWTGPGVGHDGEHPQRSDMNRVCPVSCVVPPSSRWKPVAGQSRVGLRPDVASLRGACSHAPSRPCFSGCFVDQRRTSLHTEKETLNMRLPWTSGLTTTFGFSDLDIVTETMVSVGNRTVLFVITSPRPL